MSKTTNNFSSEVRERAVRMVGEHRADHASEWEAITSIAGKIGCTAETLRRWCRDDAAGRARPAAQAADDRERLRLLEREVKELRRGECQEFRVWTGITGKKEPRYVPPQRACYTE